jgi:hypothetical protein
MFIKKAAPIFRHPPWNRDKKRRKPTFFHTDFVELNNTHAFPPNTHNF